MPGEPNRVTVNTHTHTASAQKASFIIYHSYVILKVTYLSTIGIIGYEFNFNDDQMILTGGLGCMCNLHKICNQ